MELGRFANIWGKDVFTEDLACLACLHFPMFLPFRLLLLFPPLGVHCVRVRVRVDALQKCFQVSLTHCNDVTQCLDAASWQRLWSLGTVNSGWRKGSTSEGLHGWTNSHFQKN